MRLARLRCALLAGWLAAAGCATYSEPALEPEAWATSVKSGAVGAAHATARGAAAAGAALGTAYQGVRGGFAEPDPKGYGRHPEGFAAAIRKHMVRFEGVPEQASFRFGRPEKGYLNEGLLAGGAVAWQGWLVEFEVVRAARFESQTKPERYVVRMRDGDVIEVLRAEYAEGLRWPERESRGADGGGSVAARR